MKISKSAVVSLAVAAEIAGRAPAHQPANSGSNVQTTTASTTNSAQDWTVEYEQTVSTLASAGLISNKLAINYGNSPAYQFEYAQAAPQQQVPRGCRQ